MVLQENIIVLQVIIPLLAAPLCALFKSSRLAWTFAASAMLLSFFIAIGLLIAVLEYGPILYAMGNWAMPVGIEYRVDLLSAFFLILVSGIGVFCIFYGLHSVADEIPYEKHSIFYAVFLLCVTGLLGIIITNDAFNLYVFFEISSLASYTLIAMGQSRRALLAAFEYLILGTIGATFILIGIGLLYMMTGTLNITDMAKRISIVSESLPIVTGYIFIIIGISLKIALFPLHIWLTNAYTFAPSFVSAFLSATTTKVSLYVLIRFLFFLFGLDVSLHILPFREILMVLAIFSIVIASLVAVFEKNIKRLLAFSSIAHIGYIILGISFANKLGFIAALVHIINHAVAKCALFMGVGCVVYQKNDLVFLNDFSGLSKKMPWVMAGITIAGLSLVGVPLTAGFVSKWYFIRAALEQDNAWIAFLILFSSLLSLVYVWKILEMGYLRPASGSLSSKQIPNLMGLSFALLVLLNIVLGVYTVPTVGFAEKIVEYLHIWGNI